MICLRGGCLAFASVIFANAASGQQASGGVVQAIAGSPLDEQRRTHEALGALPVSLIRSASAVPLLPDSIVSPRWRWGLTRPRVDVTWNSALPFSLNDGAQWAGRGITTAMGGGAWASMGLLRIVLAPEIWRTANRPFPVLPGSDENRSSFASPWFNGTMSADLPVRFGSEPTTAWGFGESSIWATGRGDVDYGISTESQWWGPGIRNALVMSNNAGGVPHAFVRLARPRATRVGVVDAKVMLGALAESRFFDDVAENDLRSLSGAIVTLSPAKERTLTIGLARVAYSRLDEAELLPLHGLDFLVRNGGQITSLFGRWLMPSSHAEVYGEWARSLLPSPRSFVLAPQLSQGFTVGAQWLPPLSERMRLRLQLELTNLEQTAASPTAASVSYYTSSAVKQGYTHRGQVIGAAIGPGSQSQWLAADLMRGGHTAGVFVGRVRWHMDAYYRQPTSVTSQSHDVSMLVGARAMVRIAGRDVAGELIRQYRYNFLFQNANYGYSASDVFDKKSATVRLRIY